MEKINTDCKRRNWKLLTELFKMRETWRSSFELSLQTMKNNDNCTAAIQMLFQEH